MECRAARGRIPRDMNDGEAAGVARDADFDVDATPGLRAC